MKIEMKPVSMERLNITIGDTVETLDSIEAVEEWAETSDGNFYGVVNNEKVVAVIGGLTFWSNEYIARMEEDTYVDQT